MPTKFNPAAFNQAMTRLPAQLADNVARGAARAFAQPVVTEAKRLAPTPVADSLTVTTKLVPGAVVVTIASRGPGSYLAPWAEHGTDPHLIAATHADRQGRSINRINRLVREGSLVIGGKFVGPVVHHPGARAYPFLRPAMDTQADAGWDAARAYVAKRITAGDLARPDPADATDDGAQ